MVASRAAIRTATTAQRTLSRNPYSEGYLRARYYGGSENVDDAEELAQRRALERFKRGSAEWSVNLQPLGTFLSIFEALTALIAPKSRVMAPTLNTATSADSGVARFFHLLRFDECSLAALADNYRPNLILSGNGVDAPFNNADGRWDYARVSQVAQEVGAYHVCDISDVAGLIAVGLVPSRGAAMIFSRTGVFEHFC